MTGGETPDDGGTAAGDRRAPASRPQGRPRDAATLVVIDRTGPEPRILMGRRSMRHVFMPGITVFPGGRVDPGDAAMASLDELDSGERDRLMVDMKGRASPRRARALALAAIRETWEETGLMLGARTGRPPAPLPAGWVAFAEAGVLPRLGDLRYIGRAITPPGRPRRYDTRFFAAFAEAVAWRAPEGRLPTDELEDIGWLTFAEARAARLARVTLRTIDQLAARLAEDPGLVKRLPVPYWFARRGRPVEIEIGGAAG